MNNKNNTKELSGSEKYDSMKALNAGFEDIFFFPRDLRKLACQLYGETQEHLHFYRWSAQVDDADNRRATFYHSHLARIKEVLGENEFKKALSPAIKEWDEKFKELEEREKALPPCIKCKGPRTLPDETHNQKGNCSKCH